MTRDEIIRMAREAGIDYSFGQELERFAELVAAAEREKLNKKIAALQADVDHFFKLSGEYLERANKAEEAAVAERERCAALCESYAMPDGTSETALMAMPDWTSETALMLAAAIRGMK